MQKHTSIRGIRVHPNASNATPQSQTPTSSQPPSRTNINANIASHDASNAPSAADAGTTCDSSSQPTTMNCAPVLDNYTISIQSHAYLPIDMKSSNEVSNLTHAKNFVDSVATISSSNGQQNSLKPKDDVILLKTAKAVVVGNDNTLIANIFFDEGSQRSYIRAGFAEQLGLKPESYERLSVSGFGGVVTKHNYCNSTIGLETPSGIELVKVLISDEIVQLLNQCGCLRPKSDPRFQDLRYTNDFNDANFEVDILLGANAAYRSLGSIDERFKEPFVQQSKFGCIVSGPLPNAIPALSQNINSSLQSATSLRNPMRSERMRYWSLRMLRYWHTDVVFFCPYFSSYERHRIPPVSLVFSL